MTGCKCAIAILTLTLVLCAATTPSPGYAAYERANALFVAKKLPEALTAVDEALRSDPKLVPALTLKAKLGMAAYRLDIAEKCLQQALAISPRASYAQFLYGLVAYLGNDLTQALPRFRKARELNSNDPRAALYLGLTVESLGQTAEALALYQEAVRMARVAGELNADILLPGIKLLLLVGRLEECGQWIRQAAKLSPNSRDVHFELAHLLLKNGDPAQAAVEGETALRLSEGIVTDAAIHYLLIRAYRQSGMAEKALLHAEVMRVEETPSTGRERK
jgi:tetratricopeptide (TPR) repeat protein